MDTPAVAPSRLEVLLEKFKHIKEAYANPLKVKVSQPENVLDLMTQKTIEMIGEVYAEYYYGNALSLIELIGLLITELAEQEDQIISITDAYALSPSVFDALKVSEDLINAWIAEARGLPITLSYSKLGFRLIEALNAAYKAGAASHASDIETFDVPVESLPVLYPPKP